MENIIRCECYDDLYNQLLILSEDFGRTEVRIDFVKKCMDLEELGLTEYYFGFKTKDMTENSDFVFSTKRDDEINNCKRKFYVDFNDGDPIIIELEMESALTEYLLKEGLWEREIEEFLENYDSEKDITIVNKFPSLWDLGDHYVSEVIGIKDSYIDNVLDYKELGEEIVEDNEEYVLFKSGRVIQIIEQ